MMSSDPLQTLLDKAAIIDVFNRYATGIDTRDHDLYAQCFLDEIEVEIAGMPEGLRPSKEWVDQAISVVGSYQTTQHLISNHEISIDGDAAKGVAYLQAQHYNAVPKMPEGGVILLCSGIADAAHVKKYSGGSALCGAVNAMGKNLAVELGPRGIRVNVLSPGFIGGTTIDFNLDRDDMIAFVKRSIDCTPLGHPGEPKHMADAALFLATCEFMSGQVVEVDGGWTAT